MNLLDLRISLRRRRLDELFDLGVVILRRNFSRYFKVLVPGMILCIGINKLIGYVITDHQVYEAVILPLLFFEAAVMQLPLISLNGRIVFEVRPRIRTVLKDLKSILPRYFLRVGILQPVLFMLLAMTIVLPFRALFSNFFIGEALVLERLQGKFLSARCQSLSRGNGDRQAAFYVIWLAMLVVSLICGVYGLNSMREMLGGWADDRIPAATFLPSGIPFEIIFFPVNAYFCLCRFLLYLDTRILQEGWDIELLLQKGIEETRQDPEAIRFRRKSA